MVTRYFFCASIVSIVMHFFYVQVYVFLPVTSSLGGGGGVYSYIHVLPDQFLLKLLNSEHEYILIYTPPPPPIKALVSPVSVCIFMHCHICILLVRGLLKPQHLLFFRKC